MLTNPGTERGQKNSPANATSDAEMLMMAELLGSTLRGALRYLVWFALVELAIGAYLLLDVRAVMVNFVTGVLAIAALFNPPARFEPSPFGGSQE